MKKEKKIAVVTIEHPTTKNVVTLCVHCWIEPKWDDHSTTKNTLHMGKCEICKKGA